MQDDLEELLRKQRLAERKAFASLLYLTEARRDFVHRVERAPKNKVNKHGLLVADRLANAASLTEDGELSVTMSITAMAQNSKIDFQTFDEWLTKLQAYGLIEVIERGRGNGCPTRIRLCIREEHHKRISEFAQQRMQDHLRLQTEI